MWNEIYFALAILCALLIYMLDYGLGKPGDEMYNVQSLFFGWSFFLARKRLGKQEFELLKSQYRSQFLSIKSKTERVISTNNFKSVVFSKAREAFKWEMVLGMCPICTHFWFTLIIFFIVNIFYYQVFYFNFVLYFSFSHFLIRLIKKI